MGVLFVLVGVSLAAFGLMVVAAHPAFATQIAPAQGPSGGGEAQLTRVMQNLVTALQRLLVYLATVAITIAGVRYLAAMGNMSEVDAAKRTLKAAAIGYALAALAAALAAILRSIVGL